MVKKVVKYCVIGTIWFVTIYTILYKIDDFLYARKNNKGRKRFCTDGVWEGPTKDGITKLYNYHGHQIGEFRYDYKEE